MNSWQAGDYALTERDSDIVYVNKVSYIRQEATVTNVRTAQTFVIPVRELIPQEEKETAMIKTCTTCQRDKIKHGYQDQKYGQYKRVMNPCAGGEALRCTVCGFAQENKASKGGK